LDAGVPKETTRVHEGRPWAGGQHQVGQKTRSSRNHLGRQKGGEKSELEEKKRREWR